MIRIASFLIVLAAVVAALCGCRSIGDSGFDSRDAVHPAASPNPNGGHLVIVGGGLKKDNADIHMRFVALCAEGPIGIIPIASGDGLDAGASTAIDWRRYSGEKSVVVIPLTKDSKNANDRDITKQIASCGGLWFTGGDQSRVTATLKPNGEASECLKACFAVLAKGGVIGGTSAGAAIMTDPMITGGQSPGRRTREADETASSVRVAPGLGFLGVGLTDQHFLERGRMGRLITALHEQHIPIGFGIRENCALVVDREQHTAEALGNRAVCVLAPVYNGIGETSSESTVASLSILSTGDTVNFGATPHEFDPHSISPAHGLTRPPMEPRPKSSQASASRRIPDPWEMSVMENAFDRFENDPAVITLQNDRMTLELGGLSNSRMFVDPAHRRPPCLINVCVRMRPTAAAEPARH